MRALAVVALLITALAGLASWLLARRFTALIGRFGAALERLAAGQYGARMRVDRDDVFGGLMRDHNRLSDVLERNRERERDWIANASHELKTPLAALRARIEAVQDGVHAPSPEVMGGLHASTMRLSQLVEDLNASISRDPLAGERRRFDLSELVRAAAQGMADRLDASGREMTLDLAQAATIRGDAGRMRQVIDNLFDNAIRYTDAPGRIMVRLLARGRFVRLVVSDTAPRPPKQDMERLFDRLFRVEGSRARASGGSGLGLAICRSVVEGHGGAIRAGPSDMGGLQITIELPRADGAAARLREGPTDAA
ncbi:MAG: ATP-binding protein [Pseudomonadota bacterium]